MKYCPTCVTPSTRPQISFDERGRCNCATLQEKRTIDWDARRGMFGELIARARAAAERGGSAYDCIVPVSGGKDSTWQIVTCLEHGLKPLAITWKSPARTAIGAANLANLIRLGVDHIDWTINPKVEKAFMYEALVRFGSPAVPMHMALFSLPLSFAVRDRIPLVIWGENSAFEYGGAAELRRGFEMNEAWLRTYGGTFGTVADDWIGPRLAARDIAPYRAPTDAQLAAAGVRAVFLGCYFPWDPVKSCRVATEHGFRNNEQGPRTGYYDFADIDDDFISIHHYLKWYKFGFTRLFDNLSLEIRNGRMTRRQAIDIISDAGDQTPHDDIARFCDYVGITVEHFFQVIEKFRSPDVWSQRDGRWMIDDFLVPDWKWT